jgi:hypothetical protein
MRRTVPAIFSGVAAVMVAASLASPPNAVAQSFQVAPTYPVGPAPFAPRTGDFNRDGLPDLVVANSGANTISILYSLPGGAPPARVDYAVGTSPWDIVVSDFNADAILDLAVANAASGTTSVLLGDGQGGFTTSTIAVDGGATAVTAGDFDGDGRIDLIVGSTVPAAGHTDGALKLLRGNGTGGFGPPAMVAQLGRTSIRRITVADLNLDGRPDLVLFSYGVLNIQSIGSYLNGGGGTFTGLQGFTGSEFVVADWNTDGVPDMAVSNADAGGGTRILVGDGTGQFAPGADLGAASIRIGALAAGDFNGDGNPDLAIVNNWRSHAAILIGNGDATFTLGHEFGVGVGPQGAVVDDFDRDGKLDVAVTDSTPDVSYLKGDGTGGFAAAGAAWFHNLPGLRATGDFNNDGFADVVAGNSVVLGDGLGRLGKPIQYMAEAATGAAAGFLNGDANLDLVVTRGTSAVIVFFGDGTGHFPASSSAPLIGQPSNPALSDFNGDGNTDVVVTGTTTESVMVLLGDGAGAFGPAVIYGVTQPGAVLIGRLNADASPDLVVTRDRGSVQVLLGNGSGGFTMGGSFAIPAVSMNHVLADLNGDSQLDLAVSSIPPIPPYEVHVSVLPGNGQGGFGAAQEVFALTTLPVWPGGLAAGDFNLDSHADLAVATYQSVGPAPFLVLRGDGTGAFSPSPMLMLGSAAGPQPILTTDLNADGRPDLACDKREDVWVLLNTTISVTAGDVTVAEGNATNLIAVPVSLSAPSDRTVTVDYVTADGTATGGDYMPTAGTLTFPPGTTSRTITLAVLGDRIAEGDEALTVTLSAGPDVTIAHPHVTVTLTDDDPPGLSIADVAVREGARGPVNARYTVSLSPAAASTVTVNYATTPGTATAGVDFAPVSGQLTFAPGVTSQPIDVPVFQDTAVEAPESFSVSLSGAVNAGIAHGTGAGLILDSPRGPDFNADNQSDLVWRHDVDGRNLIWLMNGVDLVSAAATNPEVLADTRWKIVGTGDFNADGQADLLWRHATSGENVVWFLNGVDLIGGTFTTPSALTDVRWKMVGTGDFNLDGGPDILWRHDTSGENVLWYMNGTALAGGTFTTPAALADVRWKMAGVGDFNGDGKPDVLWHHTTAGQAVLWYMDGSVLVGGTFTNPNGLSDTNWRMVAVADYNGDERPDIVWRHEVSGQVVVWFMDGATLVGGAFTNPSAVPDTNWRLVGPR